MNNTVRFVVLVIIGVALTGCAMTSEWTRQKRVEEYLAENPAVGADVSSALRAKTIVKGMSMREVALCLGQPGNEDIEYMDIGDTNACIWSYNENAVNDTMVPETAVTAALFLRGPNGMTLASWLTKKDGMEPDPEPATTGSASSGRTGASAPVSSQAFAANSYTGPRGKDLPADWPSLRLGGIMKRGIESSVVLNDTLLGIGETIEGVKVLSVAEAGVLLEFNGQKFLLIKERVR